MPENSRRSLQTLTLNRIDSYIGLANIKASLLIPTASLLMGFIVAAYFNLGDATSGGAIANVLLVAGLASTAAAIACSLIVIFAYLGSGSSPGNYHSLLYFGSIAEQDLTTYLERLTDLTSDDVDEDLARQTHVLARALKKKYIWVNRSIVLLGISVGPALGLIILRATV
jgi:hypothetical protein